MSEKFVTILIMGVAGSGKTTVAKLLSKKINAFLIEADDYHSKKNIDKMSAGIPLNDNDRYDWLIKIKEEIDKRKKIQNLVVACSALKEKYRSILNIKEDYLVYLKITKKTAKTRIKNFFKFRIKFNFFRYIVVIIYFIFHNQTCFLK